MRAEWIFLEGEWHRGPWEIGHRNKILFVKKTSWAPKDTAALPGFINLHCHLELSSVDGVPGRGLGFSKWVQFLRGETEGWKLKDYEVSVLAGIYQLASSGVTTILDVGNTSANWTQGATSKTRVLASREIFGLDPVVGQERLEQAISEMQSFSSSETFEPSITGHAPFSTNLELLNSIKSHRQKNGESIEMNIHVGESFEEEEFFQKQSGGLREFAQMIYPPVADIEKKESSAQYLFNGRLDLKKELWVHANTLDEDDLDEIKHRDIALVHCPRSRDYFNHKKPDLKLWDSKEIPWGFGTDSMASNSGLNFWNELSFFFENNNYTSEEILHKATYESAAIIGRYDLGKLSEGHLADLQYIQLPKDAHPKNLLEFKPEMIEVFVNGKRSYKEIKN